MALLLMFYVIEHDCCYFAVEGIVYGITITMVGGEWAEGNVDEQTEITIDHRHGEHERQMGRESPRGRPRMF